MTADMANDVDGKAFAAIHFVLLLAGVGIAAGARYRKR